MRSYVCSFRDLKLPDGPQRLAVTKLASWEAQVSTQFHHNLYGTCTVTDGH